MIGHWRWEKSMEPKDAKSFDLGGKLISLVLDKLNRKFSNDISVCPSESYKCWFETHWKLVISIMCRGKKTVRNVIMVICYSLTLIPSSLQNNSRGQTISGHQFIDEKMRLIECNLPRIWFKVCFLLLLSFSASLWMGKVVLIKQKKKNLQQRRMKKEDWETCEERSLKQFWNQS